MNGLIKKSSGLKEPFQEEKIIKSLEAVGAKKAIINNIMQEIEQQYPHIKNTQQIFNIALEKLKDYNRGLASRYNLKKALLAFGPAGYPFEQFVGHIFAAQGYQIETNEHVQGFCVTHELDVIAIKNGTHHIVECKFHNRQRYKSDLKVSLYVQARFEDLKKSWQIDEKDTHKAHRAWIVTNTDFTEDAVRYAQCVGIKALSWKYPYKKGLKDLIAKYQLHPVTALVSLTPQQKKKLLKKNIVLCQDIQNNPGLLKSLGFSKHETNKLLQDARDTCQII